MNDDLGAHLWMACVVAFGAATIGLLLIGC